MSEISKKETDKLQESFELTGRNCQSCGTLYQGNFCPNCGQKYMEGRFHFKESTVWVFEQVFNLEKGFFYTLGALIKRPAQVFEDYLSKATVKYMHPFRFMFIMATISALVTILSGAFEADSMQVMVPGQQEKAIKETSEIMNFLKSYLSLIMMISVPFYAMGSYLLFKEKKYNYAEHLIINSYTYAIGLAYGVGLNLLIFLPNGVVWLGVLSTLLSVIVFWLIYHAFFKDNLFISLLKTLATILLATVFSFIVAAVCVAAYFLLKQLFFGAN